MKGKKSRRMALGAEVTRGGHSENKDTFSIESGGRNYEDKKRFTRNFAMKREVREKQGRN